MGKGFKVTVVGQYIAKSGVLNQEKVLKEYEIECTLPTMDKALSNIKKFLLGKILSLKYPDYSSYRTYSISKVISLDGGDAIKKPEFMDRSKLVEYVKLKALPIDTSLYPGLQELREAVLFCEKDEKGFLSQFEKRREELELKRSISNLNPDLEVNLAPEPPAAPAPRKKVTEKAVAKQAEDRIAGLAKDMIRDNEMGEMDNAGSIDNL